MKKPAPLQVLVFLMEFHRGGDEGDMRVKSAG